MAWEHREGSGSLFTNKYKEKDAHPDFTGEFMLNEVIYKISGWKKKSASGNAYLSLSVQEKNIKPATSNDGPPPVDDEIRF